jgi:hypothetical protein
MSGKSRVETQINVVMTLEKPPPDIEHLHLPLHTIAKSKLLAKEDFDSARSLELHCMLVCSSAMHNPQYKAKALERAAAQNNTLIQQRAERIRNAVMQASSEEEKNTIIDPMKNVAEDDKPANGGEVRICANCIQRERKRAGRKKLKREEEQQHWERFETERVVVFNSNEYLPFKPPEQNQRESGAPPTAHPDTESQYIPPEGSLQVTAAMRIACYCRHQSEKEGFRVIFTMKDQQGNVVAQQMSDSILITDDHKTHPPTYATMQAEGVIGTFTPTGFSPNGLPVSHSMLDLQHAAAVQQGMNPFPSSRSTGNLQGLAYGQFNPHSHVHHLPSSGYTSQATSTTMTPTSLSRPASPTGAGQMGPNKKRKSSTTIHRRIPSGLQMTRVDTNQASGSNMPSAVSTLTSPFSPTGEIGVSQQGYMTIPANNGPTNYYMGSGPPTPNDNPQPFTFNQVPVDQTMMRDMNAAAYFSHPSSAVPSRTGSPVLQQSRPNMAAYARQQNPIQTPTNSMPPGRQPPSAPHSMQAMYHQQATPGSESDNNNTPVITKITPCEGPTSGGTEVSIYGYNFPDNARVMFGDKVAHTVSYGAQALLATSPPSRPGGVNVTLVSPTGQPVNQYPATAGQRTIFTYTDKDPKMMELALRYLSQQHSGNTMGWSQMASQMATQFVNSNIGRAGIGGQGGGNMMAGGVPISKLESTMSTSLAGDADAMLSQACAGGMDELAVALLKRGANPDTRDQGGFTPLMHAAIHGRQKTFEVLLASGADPTSRSLVGYSALELAPRDARGEFEKLLMNTPRRRRRPSLQSRTSYGACSSRSWSIASASLYESEPNSTVPSRRPSATPATETVPSEIDNVTSTLPTTLASRADSFMNATAATDPATPPPAYDELFPTDLAREEATKKHCAVTTAIVNAMADVKCAAMFERQCPSRSKCSASNTEAAAEGGATAPNKAGHAGAAAMPWLCVS